MLYFVGLGLFDEKDISLKGLEVLKKVDTIYAEFFTSKLFGSSIESIKKLIGKDIIVLNRKEVEEENYFFNEAKNKKIALITGGDPLIATTHTDFLVEAKKKGIETEVIHGSSIISAALGISGLQAYKFGKTTTIPFIAPNFFPHSPYLTIKDNLKNNAHTLVLLDIQANENKYMTVNQGLKYLMKVKDEIINNDNSSINHNKSNTNSDNNNENGNKSNNHLFDDSNEINEIAIDENTLAIGIARVGSKDAIVRADKISKLIDFDFGDPLHCIVIPSKLHIVEAEYLVAIAGADDSILKT
jgi:diphthine synthase